MNVSNLCALTTAFDSAVEFETCPALPPIRSRLGPSHCGCVFGPERLIPAVLPICYGPFAALFV